MITIKKFASLCGCSTQTLRYYDKVGLLKPVHVDQWSGYRYYEKDQAVNFVKIKNFQAADFSIDEIKELLSMSDQEVQDAFDRKIAQQEHKLERIIKIKQSYLTEKTNMERLVQNLSDYLLGAVCDFQVLREFGLSPEDGEKIVEMLKKYIQQITLRHLPDEPDVQLTLEGKCFRGAKQVAEVLASLKEKGYKDTLLLGDGTDDGDGFSDENSETIWQCNGWNYVHEFFDQIPKLSPGKEYCFFFRLTEEKRTEGLEFPLFMIAAMMLRENADDIVMGCCVEHGAIGENHFRLNVKN